jgi:ubiquinone biosynthesis protein
VISIRKLGAVGRTYRHLGRYREILRVLLKYGFGDLLASLGIEQYVEIGLKMLGSRVAGRATHEGVEELTRPERVRLALEELGPTAVKLGQLLSTRPDLVPPEYVRELTKLQDEVPPFGYDQVRETIESELGRPVEQLFEEVDSQPLAAASIGQVHRARLPGGREVAVKVQRPGIRKGIEVDLEIMLHLATLMEQHVEELEFVRPTRIVEEFARRLECELDYGREAASIGRFADQFQGDETIYVPGVLRDLSTERVLTMEYVRGIKASDVNGLREAGLDLEEIARRGADLTLKQVLVHGLFHGDPHPGNVWILPDNVVCYLDFGIMGRVGPGDREDFADLVIRVVHHDERRLVDAVLRLTDYEREPDRAALGRDLVDLADQRLYRPLKELDLGDLLHRLLEILIRHGLSLKPRLFLMMRTLVMAEGLGEALDPDFDIVSRAEPFVRRVRTERYRPSRLARDLAESAVQLAHLFREIPRELRTILGQAREGRLRIEFEHRGLDPVLTTLDRISNRVAFAIVLASLIVGSSIVTLSNIPPNWNEMPVIGLVGFIMAGFLGFWLLVSILRRGKM